MPPTIIVIGGLPGTGKTTIATRLAKEIGAALYTKDVLEAAIVRSGIVEVNDLKGVGYELLSTLALSELNLSHSCIVDAIASAQRVSTYWEDILETRPKYIECVCSNELLHRERLESRCRNIESWYELSWNDVLEIKKNYHPFRESRLILDSSADLGENTIEALNYLCS